MKKKRLNKNTHLSLRIEAEIMEQVKAVTHDCGTGMSDFVRDAISSELERIKAGDKHIGDISKIDKNR